MKTELIKPIVKVGNSSGVLLPKGWLNGKAKIELIEEPLNLERDILGILKNYLPGIIGIFIVGSYARNEQEEDSDVDVLAITDNVNGQIAKGKYEIMMISKDRLSEQIEANALPLIPMLREAKPVINSSILQKYAAAKLTRKNLRFHLETTRSALEVIRSYLELKKLKSGRVSDNIIYSLILRLREIYIVDCLDANKIPSIKEFLGIIKKISGDYGAYYAYKRAKIASSKLKKVGLEQAEALYDYAAKELAEQKKWTKGRENK